MGLHHQGATFTGHVVQRMEEQPFNSCSVFSLPLNRFDLGQAVTVGDAGVDGRCPGHRFA